MIGAMARFGSVAVLMGAVWLAAFAAPAGAVRPNIPQAVSCPSVSLCVAVDDAGNVLTSTDPASGTAPWKPAQIDGGSHLSGVSCPTITLCVAFDEFDDVLSSTNPTGGAGAWKKVELDDVVDSMSCPSVTLCVGVHGSSVFTSTNPTGSAAAWTQTELPGRHALFTVACASPALCVTSDIGGLLVSIDPTGGAGAWINTPVGDKDPWFSLTCAVSGGPLCLTLDSLGHSATTTSPTAAAGTWTVATGAPTIFAPSLACPSAALCVAAGGDAISTTTNPTAPAGAWNAIRIDERGGDLVGLSCPSIALCVAIDDRGNAVRSTNPTGGGGAWTTARFDPFTHVISTADVLLDMRATMDELGQRPVPSVTKVRKSGYQLLFDDLDTGSLQLGWYAVPAGAHLAKSARQPTLVAVARSAVPDTGRVTVTIRFTAAGRKLVAQAPGRPITLHAKAVLKRATGKPVTATHTFVLHP
jgi:hypothetical protein